MPLSVSANAAATSSKLSAGLTQIKGNSINPDFYTDVYKKKKRNTYQRVLNESVKSVWQIKNSNPITLKSVDYL